MRNRQIVIRYHNKLSSVAPITVLHHVSKDTALSFLRLRQKRSVFGHVGRIASFLISILSFAVIVLQIAQVYIANKVSEESISNSKIQKAISDYEEKNALLKAEILKNSTYESISSRAATLGFSNAHNIISLFDPLKLALQNE